jgi:hypothetical protein
MSEVTLFKNDHGCVHVALKSGQTVAFIEGKLFTTNKVLEQELQAAADVGEFGIYVDANEPQIDPEFATPMDQMRKKMREELLVELAAGGRLVDAGTSSQKPLQQSMASSENIVGAGELDAATAALKQAQIDDLNKPAPEATGALSALDRLKTGKS